MNAKWMRELFRFSRKERTGIIILLLIIFLLILLGKVIPFIIHEDTRALPQWEAEVNTYLKSVGNGNSAGTSIHPEIFDPNHVDSLSLINMGLPQKVVSNWLSYRKKGGRFRDKEGVKKIYGMTPGLFEQLDSFIVFTKSSFTSVKKAEINPSIKTGLPLPRDTFIRKKGETKGLAVLKSIELNSADSVHLLEIRGIGSILASRIIRYRNLLGGYYSVAQLKEVYGMREENFVTVSPFVNVDPSVIKTFNINFSTIQELGHHPYIGYKTARKVIKLRDKLGKFTSPDVLSSIVAIDSLNRLIPYLKFTP